MSQNFAAAGNNRRSTHVVVDEGLRKFKENYRELALVINKQDKRIRFLETKAMHLAIFYVASQLAIFLWNSKPNVNQCRNWWKPFLISVSIAVGFGVSFLNTVTKYARAKYHQGMNFMDQNENYRRIVYVQRLGSAAGSAKNYTTMKHGDVVDPEEEEEEEEEEDVQPEIKRREPDMFDVYAHLSVTSGALIAFTIAVFHACSWSSVCVGGTV